MSTDIEELEIEILKYQLEKLKRDIELEQENDLVALDVFFW